jgi:S1-C subfamily serine protease
MPGLDDDDDDARNDDPDDERPMGARPSPTDRPWVHPAELQSFVATPQSPPNPPRPREWVIGVVSALVGVAATLLLLVAFGALGDRDRAAIPPPVVTSPNSPIDYAIAARVADSAADNVVTVNTNRPSSANKNGSQGSGVVWRTDRVLTSAHLVAGATSVTVSTKRGETIDAQVIGIDPTTDLCLLAVEGLDELPLPELTDDPEVGDPVVAVGAGRGNTGWTSIGVVQERNWLASDGTVAVAGLLATSTDTQPTTSGGALFDPNGRLIGILSATPGASRAGLAVPIDVARDVAEQLERTKTATHGAIGVLYGPDPQSAAGGATVLAVTEDSPAAKADPPLLAGDLITRAGDAEIHGMQDLVAEARRRRPTDRLDLTFQRDGVSKRTTVTLATAAPGVATEYGPAG